MTYINDTISNCILWGHQDEDIIFILHLLRTWQTKSSTEVKNMIDARKNFQEIANLSWLLLQFIIIVGKAPYITRLKKETSALNCPPSVGVNLMWAVYLFSQRGNNVDPTPKVFP